MKKTYLLSPDTPVSLKEKAAFGVGGGSFIFTYYMFSSMLMFYYTNVVGLSAGTVGTLMMVAAIWDGINDPMMGAIVDKTHTKYGKCRPYVFLAVVALFLTTIFVFRHPASGASVPYAYVTYILYGMSFTVLQMSYPAMMTRLTKDGVQTAVLNSSMYAGQTILGFVAGLALMPMITYFAGSAGDMDAGYSKTAVVSAIIFVVLMIPSLFIKERDFDNYEETGSAPKVPLKDLLKTVLTNKYFIILFVSASFVMVSYMMMFNALMYYCTYNLNNQNLYSAIMSISSIANILPVLLLPWCVKKFDKKYVFAAGMLMIIVGNGLRLMTGDTNLTLTSIFAAIAFIGFGFFTLILTPTMIDTAMYGISKTGTDASALIISTITLIQKAGTGIATAIMGSLMASYGFDAAAETQPAAVLGLFKHFSLTLMIVAAAIGMVLMLVFYKLSRAKMEEIQTELAGESAEAAPADESAAE